MTLIDAKQLNAITGGQALAAAEPLLFEAAELAETAAPRVVPWIARILPSAARAHETLEPGQHIRAAANREQLIQMSKDLKMPEMHPPGAD